ncbi:MAG TPA: hypothetical protein ENJ28_05390 [Gammaproteobacteria bacterium]|nr:hypothetical protein [Gammaproteobacteria bacterium]
MEILSKNCDFVDELIKKGLKSNASKDYSYDLRIVTVWKHTNCFYNYSFKEFKNALGKPSESLESIDRQIHHYKLYKKSGLYSQCTIEVMNDTIMKYYCIDNVKITKLGID